MNSIWFYPLAVHAFWLSVFANLYSADPMHAITREAVARRFRK
jgi:hypothetical protein